MPRTSGMPLVLSELKKAKKKGLTVVQAAERTNLARKTVSSHLLALETQGEAKIGAHVHTGTRGRPAAIYYAKEFAPQG